MQKNRLFSCNRTCAVAFSQQAGCPKTSSRLTHSGFNFSLTYDFRHFQMLTERLSQLEP
jgi:hypothetical protein